MTGDQLTALSNLRHGSTHMIIEKIGRREESGGARSLTASLVFETPSPSRYDLYYSVENPPGETNPDADPFLIEFLLPAMMLGEDIRIEGTVDSELLDAVRSRVMPLLLTWFPFLHEISVSSDTRAPLLPASGKGTTGLAFSAGLDACYTAVKHGDHLDWLIAARGFDVRSYQDELWRKTQKSIATAARVLDKPLHVIRTNTREISHYEAIGTRKGRIDPRYYSIGRMGAVGTFMAAMGRNFAPSCSRFMLNAGVRYEDLRPFGSHPQLDVLWSTSQQQVLHEGCEADRAEKVVFLKEHHPELLGCIRVCFLPTHGKINCSQCEKCLRTMADIRLGGAEHLAHSFQWPLDLKRIRELPLDGRRLIFWNRLRQRALDQGDHALAEAAGGALKRRPLKLEDFLSKFRSPSRRDRLLARQQWKRLRRQIVPEENGRGSSSL